MGKLQGIGVWISVTINLINCYDNPPTITSLNKNSTLWAIEGELSPVQAYAHLHIPMRVQKITERLNFLRKIKNTLPSLNLPQTSAKARKGKLVTDFVLHPLM